MSDHDEMFRDLAEPLRVRAEKAEAKLTRVEALPGKWRAEASESRSECKYWRADELEAALKEDA